jgi:putative transposase
MRCLTVSRLHLLPVIDLYTRESLEISVGQNLRSAEMAEMLNNIALRQPLLQQLPQLLKTDNGSEFEGIMLDKCLYERDIRIDFSRPGTPTDNATVQTFNSKLWQAFLKENWFMSMDVRSQTLPLTFLPKILIISSSNARYSGSEFLRTNTRYSG